jgi:perosamine synthetase
MKHKIGSRIYYTKPSITELEVAYALDAVSNGWGEKCYDYINKFETAFCQHLGVKYAIATSSATGALHMGMAALGIGSGDEVILADINWIASVAPIVHLGATPVFVDILADTWCLDPLKVEAAITPKTKAIVAVHLYGNLCDMDRLRDIAQRYSIALIEDAAEAVGSIYQDKRAGSIGDFGAFSFHGTKTMTTGEGGIFVTNNQSLYEKVLTLSNHGRHKNETKQFWAEQVGYKYKMSNLEAAVGCAQLERIELLISGKRRVFQCYADGFKNAPVQMNPEQEGTVNGFWMPTIVVDNTVTFDRVKLLSKLNNQGIDGRVFFWPLSKLPMFNEKPENEISYSIYERAINLPSYHDLTTSQIEHVVDIVNNVLVR